MSIRANQSKLSRALALSTGSIRLYVRNEDYQNGFTARSLVNLLSKGGETKEGFNLPARPVLKQFFENNQVEIMGLIKRIHPWMFKGYKAKEAYQELASKLLTMFRAWVALGGVTPSNAAYTQKVKGFDAPFYRTGNLLQFFDTEVKVDTTNK